ncbi:hypothetical protein ACIGDM_10440 [Rothia koreensis]|uniref:hypothetical protein n=1 Tax=Rothia koreensis TaxID=592378 RepID=UPI0037CAB7A0
MILESLAGIIGTRRALQLKAIGTLTKHLAEGSERRFYRLGQFRYYSERFELKQAIPDIDMKQTDRRDPAAQYLARYKEPDYFVHGYATGGVIRRPQAAEDTE